MKGLNKAVAPRLRMFGKKKIMMVCWEEPAKRVANVP